MKIAPGSDGEGSIGGIDGNIDEIDEQLRVGTG